MLFLKRYFLLTVLIFILNSTQSALPNEPEDDADSFFAMSLKELMNIEVLVTTAGKVPEKIAEIPASVVLIERKDIECYGYTTLAEILEHIPGLFPTNDYSWDGVNFGVRGFWTGVVNRNIIILVNGVNQVMDYQGNFSLTNINVPVEAIDRIEIIRGPMSVIYGTGAFFGVINIITNEDTYCKSVNIFSSSVGSHDTKKIVARTTGEEGKYQYVLNTSLYGTGGIDQPLSEMISSGSTDRTGGKLENDEKYFNFSGKLNQLTLDMTYTEAIREQYLSMPSVSQGGPNNVKRLNLGIGYKTHINDKLLIRGKLSYYNTRLDVLYDLFVEDFDFSQSIGVSAFEVDLYTLYRLNEKFEFTSGLYYRSVWDVFNEVGAPALGDPFLIHAITDLPEDNRIVTQAVYSQLTFNLLNNLRAVVGARMERMPEYSIQLKNASTESYIPMSINTTKYNYDKIAFIPRIAALYTINDNHLIKFLYGVAINRPSFQQNIDKFLGIQGDLEPERIRTYEINYLGSILHGVTTSISIYYNEMNDLLIRDHGLNPDGTYYSYFSNAGKMSTNGSEVTLRIEPVSNLLVDISGTYQKTEDLFHKDFDVAFSPNWLAYLKASYRFKKASLAITGRYVDTMKSYWDPVQENQDGSLGGRIGRHVPGYTSFGANLRIRDCIKKGVFLNLRISNLLDEDIFFPTFTNNPWADRGTMDWGRRWLFTLGYQY